MATPTWSLPFCTQKPIYKQFHKAYGLITTATTSKTVASLDTVVWFTPTVPPLRAKHLLASSHRDNHILSYWATEPAGHQPNTRQYQQQRINAASREIARSKGERHLPGSYRLLTDYVYRARSLSAPLPVGDSIWYHSFDGSWWLGKIKQPPNDSGRYVIRFLDNPSPAQIKLQESTYNTAPHAPCGLHRGSLCLHRG